MSYVILVYFLYLSVILLSAWVLGVPPENVPQDEKPTNRSWEAIPFIFVAMMLLDLLQTFFGGELTVAAKGITSDFRGGRKYISPDSIARVQVNSDRKGRTLIHVFQKRKTRYSLMIRGRRIDQTDLRLLQKACAFEFVVSSMNQSQFERTLQTQGPELLMHNRVTIGHESGFEECSHVFVHAAWSGQSGLRLRKLLHLLESDASIRIAIVDSDERYCIQRQVEAGLQIDGMGTLLTNKWKPADDQLLRR